MKILLFLLLIVLPIEGTFYFAKQAVAEQYSKPIEPDCPTILPDQGVTVYVGCVVQSNN